MTVEEQSLYEYDQGNPTGDPKNDGQHARPRTPLVAIYPKEDTLISDHPYTTFTWTDPARRKVAADFLAYLRSARVQAEFQRDGFRDYAGRPGPKIDPADGTQPAEPANKLSPPSPEVLDKLLRSWAGLRKPANVLIVMDTSGSMAESVPGTGKTKLQLAQQAATGALSEFGGADRVGLWMFSTQLIKPSQDWRELVPVAPMSAKGHTDLLKQRINGMIANGGTGLYDTTLAARDAIARNPRPDAINAVVVMTDGKNEDGNSIPLSNLTSRLHTEATTHTVRVFTISYGKDADQTVLKQIAQATDAAEYDSSDPAAIDQVFTQVLSNF